MRFAPKIWMLFLIFGLFAAPLSRGQAGSVNASIRAVSYQLGTTSKVDLTPGNLIPQAAEQRVEAKKGLAKIEVSVSGLAPPTKRVRNF